MKLLIKTLIFVLLFSFTIFAQKKKSEREIDNLKGLVKSVFVERADITVKSNKIIESKTKRESEITYNEKGERLTSKLYDYKNGLLFDSTIYGFIDGERISKDEDVETPGKMTGKIIGEIKPKKKSDPRYNYKFKYKYDKDGDVIEESLIQSDGDLWLKYVYNYKGKQRETLVYSADGSLNQKYISMLDGKRNEIETHFYNVETDKLEGKEIYEYPEFDANDNWTKKITFETEENNSKSKKPREITYRKITYY